jgi:hypothetical protein
MDRDSQAGIYVFRSSTGAMLRVCSAISLLGLLVVLATTAIGQYRADQFPNYRELRMAVQATLILIGVVAAFVALCTAFFTITVMPHGLRGYNARGLYSTVEWAEVEYVENTLMLGVPYLLVYFREAKEPLTIPTWLSNMPGFLLAVKRSAGPSHFLSRALEDVMRKKQSVEVKESE